MAKKSKFWLIRPDSFVLEMPHPVDVDELANLLDSKAGPETLGTAGWDPVADPKTVAIETTYKYWELEDR